MVRGFVASMTEVRTGSKAKPTVAAAPAGPFTPPILSGDETVDEIIQQHPGLRLALMSYGLCTCCSGGLTLHQTAAARGVPLGVVLADLEGELAKGA